MYAGLAYNRYWYHIHVVSTTYQPPSGPAPLRASGATSCSTITHSSVEINTFWVQAMASLPQASVAAHVRTAPFTVPSQQHLGTTSALMTRGQSSVMVNGPAFVKGATSPQRSTETPLAGQPTIMGGVLSTSVTVCEPLAVLPQASVAVQSRV